MFNTTNIGDTNIHVNAVSGTLVKNYKDSFFLRFQKGSPMENIIFSNTPHINDGSYAGRKIVVIQAMILAENHYLCEVMYKEDFDNMFSDKKE